MSFGRVHLFGKMLNLITLHQAQHDGAAHRGRGVARDLSGSYSPGFVAGALLALLAAGLTIPLEQKRLAEAKKVGAVPDETFNGTKRS